MRGNLDPAALAAVFRDGYGVVVGIGIGIGIGSSSSGEGGGARDFRNLNLAAFAVVGGDVADSRHLISVLLCSLG